MKTQASIRRHHLRLKQAAAARAAACRKRIRDDSGVPDVIDPPPSGKFPDPWLIDSAWLLAELDRLRELAWRIPYPSNKQLMPVQSVVDGLWRLREQLRELLALHNEMQKDWRKNASPATDPADVPTLPMPVRQRTR